MPAYSKEKQEEQIAKVRQIMVLKPNASNVTIQRILEEKGEKLDARYIGKLKTKIERERINRYNNRTKEIVISQFEDLILAMNEVLKKIAISETSTKQEQTQAISQLIRQNKLVIEMMMDMGLLERYIGRLTYEVPFAQILKDIEDAKHNKDNDKGRNDKDSDQVAK